MSTTLRAVPLTAEAFAPFGDVIQEPAFDPADPNPDRRFDDLVDITVEDGAAMVSLLRMRTVTPLPHLLTRLERHPLGSQAFIPTAPARFLVVAALGGDQPDLAGIRVFVTDGRQGVNYRKGVWHAPMSVLSPTTLVVVDRKGPGANCDFHQLPVPLRIEVCTEFGGPTGPEPTRFGDWEKAGRCSDF
jgi:ureidoglycolate lyase